MRIKILSIAEDDLDEGHRYYESQADGLGIYFLDTLYSDIDSLAYFAGMPCAAARTTTRQLLPRVLCRTPISESCGRCQRLNGWLARWKARGRLSLADAIALAIAETRNLKLVSADHHELDSLEAEGLIRVEWSR
ncbi:MAG: hypothetical protein A3F73_05950 [Gallionellales bacterium RIFCSPLOWO2_12_FULL_59_22]|nr:MAG: hypothetical protein A3H99_06270 [Gallionellales bacterium RIFCSPLOWO2_02_FULL_59_110]OGT11671.1 MAG: hypothetical protein A3F73_05950 [Gallionellales bacterium RIFCSPLOWO2_12_FULL_59_22]